MQVDEKKIIIASSVFAIVGILILLFISNAAVKMSVSQATVAQENTLVILEGTVANATDVKFSLCDIACISVKGKDLPSLLLLTDGRNAVVEGRVKTYMGRRYVEAENIEVK